MKKDENTAGVEANAKKTKANKYMYNDGSLTKQGERRANDPEIKALSQKMRNDYNGVSNYKKHTAKEANEIANRAKKTGMYDIDFVEATQNKKFSYDDDDTTFNKEYRMYLKDPDSYMKTLHKRHKDV